MGNGRAKRAGLGAYRVHMNPLVVAGRLGKLVDLLLGDSDPIASGYWLPGQGGQLLQIFKISHRKRFFQKGTNRPSSLQPLANRLPLLAVLFHTAGLHIKHREPIGGQVHIILGVAQGSYLG